MLYYIQSMIRPRKGFDMNSITRLIATLICASIAVFLLWTSEGLLQLLAGGGFLLQAWAFAHPKSLSMFLLWQSSQVQKLKGFYVLAWKACPISAKSHVVMWGALPTTLVIAVPMSALGMTVDGFLGWIGIMLFAFVINAVVIVPLIGAFFVRRSANDNEQSA